VRELSLFSGAGGGLLGTSLLGWTHMGYVEYDDYCQRVIAQRIKDGYLNEAPIFGDINSFISEGYAASYTGMVDVITAGFPCQPFSTAGRRQGADDSRNMWPATIECIRVVRPRYCFLENVPGLLSSGYFGIILADLAESGYDARWRILSAAEVGAPHRRNRLWIVGYTKKSGRASKSIEPKRPILGQRSETFTSASLQQDVANANGKRVFSVWSQPGGKQRKEIHKSEWAVEPDVGRVVDGVASRVDRLKAIGNGQVPQCVAKAWQLLTSDWSSL